MYINKRKTNLREEIDFCAFTYLVLLFVPTDKKPQAGKLRAKTKSVVLVIRMRLRKAYPLRGEALPVGRWWGGDSPARAISKPYSARHSEERSAK